MIKLKGKWKKASVLCLLILLLGCLCTVRPVYAGGKCTLSVKSGQDITGKLKTAIRKYDTIRIPSGTYRISGSLSLDNKTVIQASSGRVVLKQTRSGKSIFTATRSTKKLTLQNITLDGQNRSGSLLSVKNASGLTLKSVQFVNSRSYGLYMNRSKATLTDCAFNNNKKTSLYALNSSTVTMTNCSVSSGKEGIYLNSKSKGSLTNVQIADMSTYGLSLNGSANLTKVLNSTIVRCTSRGVYVRKGCSATLQNCTVAANGLDGIYVDYGKAALTNCLITGNGHEEKTSTYNSIGYGVRIRNKASVVMKGCQVNSNLGYGVICSSGTLDVQGTAQSYCEFMYNAWSGLSFSGSNSKIIMNYARCSENGYDPKGNSEGQNGHGLGVTDGAKGTVKNSIFNHNGVCGISLFGNNAVLNIESCIASDNGRHGIGGRKGVTLTAVNMTLNNNVQHGIMLLDNSTGTMTAVTANDNGKFGLDIGQTTKSVSVNGCTVNGNSDGVYIYTAKNVRVSNTKGSQNLRYGLYVSKDASAVLSGNTFKNNYRKDISIN